MAEDVRNGGPVCEGGVAPPDRRAGHGIRAGLLAALAVMAVAFCVYCGVRLFGRHPQGARYLPARAISLEAGEQPAAANGRESVKPASVLRVAVAPVISPEKSLLLYDALVARLGEAVGRKGVLLQRPSYAEVNELIRHGECDIAFVCTYAFVRCERDFGLKLLAVPVVGGRLTYRSYIIVPARSEAGSLLDLRGKRFASPNLLSNSGWLFPFTWLVGKGEDPERFFRDHVLTGSHDASIRAVASSFVDGAAVDSLVYEQLMEEDSSLGARARVIMKSPEFGMPPVVASPVVDPALRERILDALLRLHETPEGQEALRKVRIDRFQVPESAMYDSVRKASDVWESRK